MVPVTSPDKVKQPRVRSPGPVLTIQQKGTNRMQIRAAELTADNLSRIVRIDHDDDTFVVGRLVKIRHRRFGDAGAHDIDTRVVIEVLGDQRVAKRFDAIGVVELL
jgi:hypothetical protein